MKVAIISDIHGNVTALSAIAREIKSEQADECWFLGDLVMPGPATNELFTILEALNTTVYLRGNWDDWFLSIIDKQPLDYLSGASFVYRAVLADFLNQQMQPENIEKLRRFKMKTVRKMDDLTIGLSHNLPNQNYGSPLMPQANSAVFSPLFETPSIDIGIYGHIHHQIMRYAENDQLILNPGSVGEPDNAHPALRLNRKAEYLLLTFDKLGVSDMAFKKVAYDIQAEIKRAQAIDLPYLAYYRQLIEYGSSSVHDKAFMLQKIKFSSTDTVLYQQSLTLRNQTLRNPSCNPLNTHDMIVERDNQFYGLMSNGILLGTLSIYPISATRVRLVSFAIRSDLQHKHLGTLLLEFVKSDLKAQNITSISLAARLSAQLFYERNGFIVENEAKVVSDASTIEMYCLLS